MLVKDVIFTRNQHGPAEVPSGGSRLHDLIDPRGRGVERLLLA
jgi:hypothetical protein